MKTPLMISLGLAVTTLMQAAAPQTADAALTVWLGDKPGGVVAAVVNAETVTFASAGKFSATDPRAVGPDTQFEIGSITKTFTALLAALAVEANQLEIDAVVGAPFAPSAVTYRQLLTHTSGLPSLPADMVMSDHSDPYARETMGSLTTSFAGEAPNAKPGKMNYSNLGFAVLGHALAHHGAAPYAELVRARILQPLGLTQTTMGFALADPSQLAPGHDKAGQPAKNWTLGAYSPAGAIASSARDLARYAQMQIDVIESPLRAAIIRSHEVLATDENSGLSFAYAWMTRVRDGRRVFWHAGGTGGYQSFLVFDPRARRAVVVLSNHGEDVSRLAMALFSGKPFESDLSATTSSEASPYAGRFALSPSFILTVAQVGPDLTVQATGQSRFKLIETGANRFRLDGVDAELRFELDVEGKAHAVVLHQHGMAQRAPRMMSAESSRPTEITVEASKLADYVGAYALGEARFDVKVDEGRLLVRLTNQPWAQVFASAPDKFFYKIVDAQLSFVRDANGQVSALILHQNGLNQRAEKID